jgi:hypothetical protein
VPDATVFDEAKEFLENAVKRLDTPANQNSDELRVLKEAFEFLERGNALIVPKLD